MLNVIIFGAPGSGKGTQSEVLIEKYGFDHVSTGDLLRAAIKNETELGKAAKQYMDAGQLVPDELIIGLIEKVLEERKPKVGLILDGFPRTIPQADALAELFAKYDTSVHAVQDSGRSDDNLETIQKRLAVYHAQTAPLAQYYAERGVHFPLQGSGAISDITARISSVIDALKK